MEISDEISEKIDRVSFTVANIPVKLLKEFKFFCKEECGDIYWVGLKQLLKIKNEHETLLPILSNLQAEISEIKNQLNKPKVREEPRTFSHK